MDEQTPLKKIEYHTVHSRFTLEDFARTYVQEAIRLARESLSTEEYDKRIVEEVSGRMRMSHNEIETLQKPFYWGLVSGNGCSPLRHIPARVPGEHSRIVLNEGYDSSKIEDLVNGLLSEKNCEYLDSRIRRLLTQIFGADVETGPSLEGGYSLEEIYG
jgi:hypothetical protein